MPAKEVKAYATAQNNASLLAQRDMERLWLRIREYPPKTIRDILLATVPGIIAKYGNMAALAAAEYVEAERLAAGWPDDFSAEIAEGVPMEQIEASIRYACGHLFGEVSGDGARPGQDDSLFDGQD